MAEPSHALTDLHVEMMDQLRRLKEAEGEGVKSEIERSKAVVAIGSVIVDNLKVASDVQRLMVEYGKSVKVPKLLGDQ